MKNILVAVAWPYANADIHVGNITGSYLPADIFARYHRLKGNRVLMVSGTDGHGTPITVRADSEGRLFVGCRECLLLYSPDGQNGWQKARELFRFPNDSWVNDISIRGDDLYVTTKEHIQAFSETDLRELIAAEFSLDDHAYLYHVLGQFMDATLFALMKIPSVRKRFWDENPFYAESSTNGSNSTSPLGQALRAANAVAYTESKLLRRRGYGAAGLLFTASPRVV